MGTESPDLLLEEYRLIQEVLSAKDPEEAARLEKEHEMQSQSVIRRRDQFIARRINESLRPGEIGILFLGVLHSVALLLEKDIRVTYPIYRPRRSEGGHHDSSPSTNPGRRRLR